MRRAAIDVPLAVALGFVPVALIDVAVTLARYGLDRGAPGVRIGHLAFLVGYRAALALALALVAAVLMRVLAAWPTRPRFGRLVAAGLLVSIAIVVGSQVFADDVYSYVPLQRVGLTLALSLVPVGFVVLRLLVGAFESWRASGAWARPRWLRRCEAAALRVPFVAVGVGAALLNDLGLRFGNRGPHLGLLVVAGVGFGLAIVGLRWPFARRPGGRTRRIAAAIFAAWALWSLVARPPSRVAFELARNDSPGLYAFLAPLRSGGDEAEAEVDVEWLTRFAGDPRWFERRDDAPPTAPSRPLVDPSQVLVVLVTIDAMREDVFSDPRYAATMPNLQALRAESTVFRRAHASSPTTAPSVAAIFTGRHVSGLYWTPVPFDRGQRVRYYPVEDPSPRLPELLPPAVRSFNVPATERLRQQYAVVRGMREEAQTDTSEDLLAAQVMPIVGDWVRGVGAGPAFVYVHLMDGHSPYTSAGTEGPVFERYLRGFGRVDAALGELRATLVREGLWSRTVLIIAADHGEAFGEHGQTEHGGTLQEELTRVPMMIRVPGQAAREVEERVSLIDLGPTILDLFQQPTPGSFLGQSLLPLVAGGDEALVRPIALESSRLHRALIFRDGMKCVWRSREDQYELYDLNHDPRELDNLVDTEPSAALRKAAVRRFFRANALLRPGYTTPHYWP